MSEFSKSSKDKLDTCHNDLQVLFLEVIKSFDCTVVCGHRGEEEQNKAYNEGNSQLQFPRSKHNRLPSLAVDVVPFPIDWRDLNRMRFFSGYVLGIAQVLKDSGKMTHSIRWGGDWNSDSELADNRFNDFPHFEIV